MLDHDPFTKKTDRGPPESPGFGVEFGSQKSMNTYETISQSIPGRKVAEPSDKSNRNSKSFQRVPASSWKKGNLCLVEPLSFQLLSVQNRFNSRTQVELRGEAKSPLDHPRRSTNMKHPEEHQPKTHTQMARRVGPPQIQKESSLFPVY